MWRKLLVVMLAVVIILPSVSCDKEPSVEEVLDGIIAAADDITTLSYDMNAEMNMIFSTIAEGRGPRPYQADVEMTLSGVLDVENKDMLLDADIGFGLTDAASSSTDSSMSMDMGMELYLLDNTGYIMTDIPMMGVTWQKYSLSAEEIQQIEEMLGRQDSMLNPQMILEMAEVTIEGSGTINGISCYRLKLEMDPEKVW